MPDQFFGFDPVDKQGYDVWSPYLGIVGCYTALNFVGYGTDKGIADPKSLPNIMSDAAHIAIASFCDAVMSERQTVLQKGKRNIQTQESPYASNSDGTSKWLTTA